MTHGWKAMKLADVAEVIAGQSPEGTFYNSAGDGLPFYQGKTLFGDKFIGEPTTWTTQTTKLAVEGDVLMSVRAPVGPVNFATQDCCIGRGLAAIRCGTDLHRDFLFYFLLSKQTEICGTEGAVFASINKNDIGQISISIPGRGEQQRIVGILDEAFEGIDTTRGNTEANLEGCRVLFESAIEFAMAGYDHPVSTAPIGDHIRFIDYRGRTPVKTTTGLRLITAKNVRMGYVRDEPTEFVAPESYGSWMTRGIPQKGDVLFTTEAPLANVAQLNTDERVVFAQRVIIMQPDPSVLDSTYLKYLLLSASVQRRIHEKGTGATASGIKASLLKAIEISFPRSLDEQRAITARLDQLSIESDHLKSYYRRKLAALDELKQSLLHQAFSGAL